MSFVIYREDAKTHTETFVAGKEQNGQPKTTQYGGAAKTFPTRRAAYDWAATAKSLQYWKVRSL